MGDSAEPSDRGVIRPVVSLTPSRRNLQKARRFGDRGESLDVYKRQGHDRYDDEIPAVDALLGRQVVFGDRAEDVYKRQAVFCAGVMPGRAEAMMPTVGRPKASAAR